MKKIEEKFPDAIEWLDENHPYLWSRSQFSDQCKVDHINNNLSECFNKWIMKTKDLQIVNMHNKIRQMIITKFDLRGIIDRKMRGKIIPSISNALNAQQKAIKNHEVTQCGDDTAEVSCTTSLEFLWRHAVDLKAKTCSCRAWQITGKPCSYALAFLGKIRQIEIDDFVDDYYSVERFQKTCKFFCSNDI
uniref:Zinc finger PMZ-type domain-containing protein n=1 Tax=Arundo donax TaxID=35708 RepID=A0A0A8ZXH5_ARUDO